MELHCDGIGQYIMLCYLNTLKIYFLMTFLVLNLTYMYMAVPSIVYITLDSWLCVSLVYISFTAHGYTEYQ